MVFTGVRVSASLLKSTGLFSVFWPISTMLFFKKYLSVPLFPSSPGFGECTKRTNYNWHYHRFHVPRFFQFLSKVDILNTFFAFFQVYSVVRRNSNVLNLESSLFFVDYYKAGSSVRDKDICLNLKILEVFVRVILQGRC